MTTSTSTFPIFTVRRFDCLWFLFIVLLLLLSLTTTMTITITPTHGMTTTTTTTRTMLTSSFKSSTFITTSNRAICDMYSTTTTTSAVSSGPITTTTTTTTRCVCTIMMGKGEGKKKRSKKKQSNNNKLSSSSSSSSSQSQSRQPVPQRVSTQINVPIRKQIAYGKINKEYRDRINNNGSGNGRSSFRQRNNKMISGGGSNPTVVRRTKYRKQVDPETIQQKALERQRKGQDPDWDVILNQTKANPIMFVDGYNIIYKWARLKKHMMKGDTDKARRLLLDDLESLASIKSWRIECVFDGSKNTNGGNVLGGPTSTTSKNTAAARTPTKSIYNPHQNTVRVVYTGKGIEADTYIEQRCMDAKNITLGKITSSLMVATDDTMIKLTAMNAGAVCMSADRFVSELKAVKKIMQYRVEAAMAKVNDRTIRPEKLWGTNIFLPSSNTASLPIKEIEEVRPDGTVVYIHRFGRSELIIEDKRNKHKNKLRQKQQQQQQLQQSEMASNITSDVDHHSNNDDMDNVNGANGNITNRDTR